MSEPDSNAPKPNAAPDFSVMRVDTKPESEENEHIDGRPLPDGAAASTKFIRTPELRSKMLAEFDKVELAVIMRVDRALFSDVATLVYKEVSFDHMRLKMTRMTVSRTTFVPSWTHTQERGAMYCDSVRTVVVDGDLQAPHIIQRAARIDWSKHGLSQNLTFDEGCALVVMQMVRQKCPKAAKINIHDLRVEIELGENIATGRITSYRIMSIPDKGQPVEPNAPLPSYQPGTEPYPLYNLTGYDRVFDRINLSIEHGVALRAQLFKALPAPVRSLKLLTFNLNMDEIRAIPQWLCQNDKDALDKLGVLAVASPWAQQLDVAAEIMKAFTAAKLFAFSLGFCFLPDRPVLHVDDFPDVIRATKLYLPTLHQLQLGLEWLPSDGESARALDMPDARLRVLELWFSAPLTHGSKACNFLYQCAKIMQDDHDVRFGLGYTPEHTGATGVHEPSMPEMQEWVTEFRK